MSLNSLLNNERTFFHSKYKLIDQVQIGQGSFSSVYLIEDLKTKNK
jgi:hypothetical protein